MSIIQTIRDKGAKISVALIALALVGFILTDYFSGRGRNAFSGGGSNNVGSVNGSSISYDDLKKRADQQEANFKQQGYPSSPAMTQEAVNQAWTQEVNLRLYRSEIKKLGMRIGKKERGDLLYGANAPDFIKKAGTDENGVYDAVRAKQQVDQMMKDRRTPQAQKEEFNTYIGELDEYRMSEKYNSLFSSSVNFPRWYVEKQTNDYAQIANIAMVKMLYTDSSFIDSTIKIEDKEIQDYINKHKEQFKQEKSRGINYVTFSAAPTLADTLEAKKKLTDLKPEFDTTTDVAMFVARNGNPEPPENYFSPAQLPPTGKDSIIRLAKNHIYGPYLEGGSYVMVKLLDTKTLPDSVKSRHILIQTFNPQTNQQLLDDSTAKKRIDSLEAAIKAGARFDTLALKFSDDKGSGARGGVLQNPQNPATDYYTNGQMVKEFNDFSLQGKTGERKVVKTVFGYHLIEILDQKNFQPNYKVAFLAEEVRPSQQTDNDAVQAANAFFGDVKDQKTFDAAYEKLVKPTGGVKGVATNIGPLDAQVGGTTGGTPLVSRGFVMNIYKAKLGEVLKPEKVDNNYVVAIVTEINNEGTQSVAKARPAIESELRKKKKAEIIKQKIGTVTTLEDAAAKLGKPIEIVDSLRMDMNSFSPKLGNEPKIKGAAFNAANKGKVTGPIAGVSGVYVIRVDNVAATPSQAGSVADQRKERYDRAKQQQQGGPIQALKKAATIKDKRADRF